MQTAARERASPNMTHSESPTKQSTRLTAYLIIPPAQADIRGAFLTQNPRDLAACVRRCCLRTTLLRTEHTSPYMQQSRRLEMSAGKI